MPFKKGQSGNPKGKAEGTRSKKTEQWELLSGHLLNEGAERFQTELGKLTGKDYCDMYAKTMEYFKPKLTRSQLEHSGGVSISDLVSKAKENV